MIPKSKGIPQLSNCRNLSHTLTLESQPIWVDATESQGRYQEPNRVQNPNIQDDKEMSETQDIVEACTHHQNDNIIIHTKVQEVEETPISQAHNPQGSTRITLSTAIQ